MLYAYTYVSHSMEKMQAYIDFIFYEVWCKAPGNGGFRLDLFDPNAELREVMEAFNYGDTRERWSPIVGQFGGLVKVEGVCCHAAASIAAAVGRPQYASSGVLPSRREWGRRWL